MENSDDLLGKLGGKDNVNVLSLVKGEERYVYLYTDETRAECLRALGRHAGNPDLSFTWYDAAVMSQKIRQATEEENQRDEKPERDALPMVEEEYAEEGSPPFDEFGSPLEAGTSSIRKSR